MNKRRNYYRRQMPDDLYQYEMAIELGAEVEAAKQKHLQVYEKQPCCMEQQSKSSSYTGISPSITNDDQKR